MAKRLAGFRSWMSSRLRSPARRQLEQTRDQLGLLFEIEGGNEQGHKQMGIGPLLIALEPADLHLAIADGNRHLPLAELSPPPQVLQEIAETRERCGRDRGRSAGHGAS